MARGDHILAIDHGTQSVRALLFDPRGTLVHKARVEVEPYTSPRPGWAEQDPELYWRSLGEACRLLWAASSVPREAVAGVALTTQRATMINVDRARQAAAAGHRLARPAPHRGPGAGRRRVGRRLPRSRGWRRRWPISRPRPRPTGSMPTSREVWEQTHKYLFLSGFLTHRLVGRFVDSVGCQVGYVPFDYTRPALGGSTATGSGGALAIEREMLPELVPPGEVLGEITAAASAATGIPAGLPLIAAAADKACEVIGAGCLEPHVACLSYGTDGHHQHDAPALRRGDPDDPALPGGGARRLHARGADQPRLLDGRRGSSGSSGSASSGSRTSAASRRRSSSTSWWPPSRRARWGWCCSPTGRPASRCPGPRPRVR